MHSGLIAFSFSTEPLHFFVISTFFFWAAAWETDQQDGTRWKIFVTKCAKLNSPRQKNENILDRRAGRAKTTGSCKN